MAPLNPEALKGGRGTRIRSQSKRSGLFTGDLPGPSFPIISGALGHWIASLGVIESGGNVSSWEDQSGQGNHWNTNTGTDPTIVASVLNGEPVIKFGGLASMSQAAFVLSGSGGEMISVLRSRAVAGAANGWSTFSTSSATAYLTAADDTITEHFATSLPQSGIPHFGQMDQDKWAYYGAGNNSLTLSERDIIINGGLVSDGTLFTRNFNVLGTYYLGDGDNGNAIGAGEGWDGEIAEIVFYDRVLTYDERQSIYQYFDAKYGLSFSGAPFKSNLVGHWDNAGIVSSGDGTEVTQWTDNTGNGWHLTDSGGVRPKHFAANLNGLDVVDFRLTESPAGVFYLDVSGGLPVSTEASMYFVAITDSIPGVNAQQYHNVGASAPGSHHPWVDGRWYDDFGGTTRVENLVPPWDHYSWHTFSGRVGAGTRQFHSGQNSVLTLASSAAVVVGWKGTPWHIGPYKGRMAEILLFDKKHSNQEVLAVHRYLWGKWGL